MRPSASAFPILWLLVCLTSSVPAAGSTAVGRIQGLVVNLADGRPVAGASVVLPGTGVGAVTDSTGAFFLPDVPAGPGRVAASHVAFQGRTARVEVPPGATVTLRIELMPVAIPLGELEVTAAPVGAAAIHRAPSFVTVVPRESFEGQATSVPEVLSTSTGVQVKRLGGLGSFSTISVRGSSAEQVEIYLDGIPLNTALGGGVNLENLPLSQVAQVEVYRGAGLEGAGVGGTVHIRTLGRGAGTTTGSSLSWGSFDTRSASFLVSGMKGLGELTVLGDYQSSDNDFQYLDDNGTEYNPDDDARVARRNSDFQSASLLGKWSRRVRGAGRFYLQENLFWKHQGLPGLGSNQADHARLNTLRSLTEAGWVVDGILDRFSLRQSLFFAYRREGFQDPEGEIGIGREDNEYVTRSSGWSGTLEAVAAGGSSAALRASVRREAFNPSSRLQASAQSLESGRWSLSTGAGGDWSLSDDRAVVSASADLVHLRSRVYDENPYRFSPLAPDTTTSELLLSLRAGIRVSLLPGLALKANAGRGHRAPSFSELFGDRGGLLGNTGLRPERGLTWDTGLRAATQDGSSLLEAVYYDHRYKDLIQYMQFSQGVGRAQNIGGARSRGVELTGAWAAGRRLRLSGNYTYQKAVDESEVPHQRGKILPNRPQHEAEARGAFTLGPATLFYRYTFEDGNFLDRANLRPVASRHIHNAGLRVALSRGTEITLEAKNLLDNQVADLWGYPLPGRACFVTLKHSRSESNRTPAR